MAGYDIHKLLEIVVAKNASDLHITVGSPPKIRLDGVLYPVKVPPLTGDVAISLLYSVLTEKQKKKFEETNEIDFSFKWKRGIRFRANFFRQKGYIAGAIRQIPSTTPPITDLGLPKAIEGLLNKPSGLILVTGPTGSGKSTTLASMIDYINEKFRKHIITIEDPIEFVHEHKNSIVNQREIGSDTESFVSALRYILRQDPDVVLIGEIRDKESMEAALRISETGHLVLTTLHTNNAIQTIHRVIDFFPGNQKEMIRTQFSFVVAAIISQQLLKKATGSGRVLAAEVLIPNPAIRNLIREDKIHQIYTQMQIGQLKSNMQTMNQSLFNLISKRLITVEDALSKSYDPDELRKMIESNTGKPVRR